MEYSDHLGDDGKFIDQGQVDRYIASGTMPEIFKNKFNYHGYRYIRLSNLKVPPAADSIRGYLIQTGFEMKSGFECSDPDLNRIHDMIRNTIRCLSLGGYLVDCPQYERLGYGGDGNASTETAQTMFGLGPLYSNWLQAWADCIRDDGGMPHTAPNPYPAGGGPYWCGFIITASWRTYLHYGDRSILEDYYPVMQKWLGFVRNHSVDGLLKRWPDTDYRGWYLGDWAVPDGVDQTAQSSIDLVNNCYIAVCFETMRKIAKVLDKTADAGIYESEASRIRKLIHERFYDPGKGIYGAGTQIDLAFPLLAGVVPEDLTDVVTRSLFDETEINRGGHFACGLVGIPVITDWAVRNGAADLMYTMLKKKDYPGYLFMIENGATTTWEHWNGNRSRIHNCYNGIGQWFYQALGGIRPVDGQAAWKEFMIQPQIPEGVTWARTHVETPMGTIKINWSLIDNNLSMDVTIPAGASAKLCRPGKARKTIINKKELPVSADTANLQSGSYSIKVTI
jgi:alpha-L-rhamnosidase